MDAPGISEGVQAVRVIFEGGEMFLKLVGSFTSWSLDKITKLAALLYGTYKEKKNELAVGEVNFSELVKKDRNGVGIMQIDTSVMEEFREYAAEMNLSYTIMPDINKQDSYCEVAYGESQGEAVRYFIAQNPLYAHTYTYGEYIDNADEKDIAEEMSRLDPNGDAVRQAQKLKQEGYEEMKVSSDIVPVAEGDDYESIVMEEGSEVIEVESSYISKTASEHDKDKSILVAVPNRENEYVKVSIDRISRKNDRLYVAMHKDETFDIVDINEEKGDRKISASEIKERYNNIERANLVNAARHENIEGKTKFVLRNKDGEQSRVMEAAEFIIKKETLKNVHDVKKAVKPKSL